MDKQIKYLLLQKSELVYEVAIRGETPSDNVAGLRRQVNNLTQRYPADEIVESVFEFSEHIKGIHETLDKIKTNLVSLQGQYDEPLFNRTKSTLNHIYYRLDRIEAPKKSEDQHILTTIRQSFDSAYELLKRLANSKQVKVNVNKQTPAPVEVAGSASTPSLDGLNISLL